MEESVTIQEFLTYYRQCMRLEPVDENSYSPLVLAYIGDSVYEVIIRTKVINRGSMQVNKMHKQSSELVKAGTQAELIKAIEDMLTQEEHAVFKRGRNAKSATSAKNASVIDYRHRHSDSSTCRPRRDNSAGTRRPEAKPSVRFH